MISHALRLFVVLALTVLCLGSDGGGNNYVIDYPGKANIVVEPANTSRFGLKPAEAAAFHANLRHLCDLLMVQPVFHPLLGVEANGYIRADQGGEVIKTAPVRGYGFLIYYPYVLPPNSPKPWKMNASPWQMVIHFNDPVGYLQHYGKIFYEPRQVGQLHGFPVYRGADYEFIVLSSTSKPAWVPVTREEYIQLSIREIEKELADEAKGKSKNRLNLNKDELALLSPKDRAEIERLLGDDTALEMIKQRLKRHQEALARMSPQERTVQAQNGAPGDGDALGPQLAPVGKEGIGPAYVKANADWFDPSRPRSDLQLITIGFDYAGSIDPEHPELPYKFGEAVGLRLWETLHKSDWRAISGALSK